MQLTITKNSEELHQALAERVSGGGKVALVPTMGALHAGHISLVEEAKNMPTMW